MRSAKVRLRTSRLTMLLAGLGLVVSSAAPAAAQELVTVGAGAGTGVELTPTPTNCEPEPEPLGNPLTGNLYPTVQFELNHGSTYDSVDDDVTIAAYAGVTQMKIDLGPTVQAPQGARPGPCGGIVTPAPVPIQQVTINDIDPSVGGNVSCVGTNNGYYLRVNTEVVFDFTVSCNLEGNVVPGAVTNVNLHHRVTGEQIPCLPPLFAPCVPLDPRESATSVMQTEFEADSLTA